MPSVRQALAEIGERKTEQDTETFLRQNSPVMQVEKIDQISGKYFSELRQINDCSNAELIEHIDTIKQFAAENLNIYIEDPKIL